MNFFRTLAAGVLAAGLTVSAQSIVDRRGAIRVDGTKFLDQAGKPLQLTGMSLYWDIWGGEKFYNKEVVDWLVSDWKVSLVRAAMGITPGGGYLSSPGSAKDHIKLVDAVVQAAIANGIYVIIDWHEEQAPEHLDSALSFFGAMARKYGDQPNVIFEVYNEPNLAPDRHAYTWPEIYDYALPVIEEIRKYSQNLVIVGTPKFSADLTHPLYQLFDPAKYPNIAYTFHFYACTHHSSLLGGLPGQLPVFITEWGSTDYSGNGVTCLKTLPTGMSGSTVDDWYSKEIDKYKLSSANWSLSAQPESSAVLVAGTVAPSGWDTINDLKPTGQYVRAMIRKHCTSDPTVCPYLGTPPVPTTFILPGSIPANGYMSKGAIVLEPTTEPSGGQNLRSIDNGDVISYKIRFETKDSVRFRARIASLAPEGGLRIRLDGKVVDTIFAGWSGGADLWYWAYGANHVVVDSGEHVLDLVGYGAGYDLMRVHHLEASHFSTENTLPGQIWPLHNYGNIAGFRYGPVTDSSEPGLVHGFVGAKASWSYVTDVADSVHLQVRVSNGSGSVAKLLLRTGGSMVGAQRKLDTITVPSLGWDSSQVLTKSIPVFNGKGVSNYLTITVSGDSGVDLVRIGGLGMNAKVGVRTRHSLEGFSATRSSNRLTVDFPAAAGIRSVELVNARGQILTNTPVSGPSATLLLPLTRQPLWLRLRGTKSVTLSVPAGN